MQLALIGATGLVGQETLQVLAERHFPVHTLLPVASARSMGTSLTWAGKTHTLIDLESALAARPTLALLATEAAISRTWAPRFVAAGTTVIDYSTAWRMEATCPLVVPEVNGHLLCAQDRLVANPNCSTIQLVMALAPLHQRYGLKRLVIATYQAVTGSGQAAVDQLQAERQGQLGAARTYPHPIDQNLIPHIDDFLDNGMTKEELKLVNEPRKILHDDSIQITATAVRVPVVGGHSLAVNVTLGQDFDLTEVVALLRHAPGVVVQNEVAKNQYPMPLYARHRDEVWVGRIRRDDSQPRTLNLWIVADNLRKGAATNAVQIAECMLQWIR